MSRRTFLLVSSLIIALAFGLRVLDLPVAPPALHYDEAANGQFVTEIAFQNYRPVFIAPYTGKEVLWFYLAGALMWLMGPAAGTIFPLRLASVFIGTVGVAAAGFMIRRLYYEHRYRDWLALLTMAVLATRFWQGILSRLVFRAISQPLMQALAVGFLFWAWQTLPGRKRWIRFAIAGLLTGLAAHTYLAVRLFPIVLALAWLVMLIFDRERIERLKEAIVYGLSALIAAGPLLWYFYQHPEAFGTRLEQIGPATTSELIFGWTEAAKIFFIQGDVLWRHNIAGKPIFDSKLGILFVLGVIIALVMTFRRKPAIEHARDILILSWPVVMLAPTALATNSNIPSNLRAVGLAPVVTLFPAIAIVTIGIWLKRWGGDLIERWMLPVALASVMLVSGGAMAFDVKYWQSEPQLWYDEHGPVVTQGQFMDANARPDDTIYMATRYHEHPTLSYVSESYAQERSIAGGGTLLIAPEGSTFHTFAEDYPPPDDWQTWLADYALETPIGPEDRPDLYAYRLPEGYQPPIPLFDEPYNFGHIIHLTGAMLRPAVSGEFAEVDVLWEIIQTPSVGDYAIIAEVCDAWGRCTLGHNADGDIEHGIGNGYPSSRWTPGETMLTRLTVPLAEGLAPGEYTVSIRVKSPTVPELSLIGAQGGFAGLTADIGPLVITANTSPDLSQVQAVNQLDATVDSSVTLLGYDFPIAEKRPGERLDLTLYWQALAAMDPRTVSVTLDDGTMLYEGDPVHGTYPTDAWQPGEVIMDHIDVRLPVDVAPGEYSIRVQLGNHIPIDVTSVTVLEANRSFEIPATMTLLDTPVDLGGQVSLLGYDIPTTTIAPGDVLPLTLAWRSEAATDLRYTVFVHLVAPDGTNAAQTDRQPQVNGQDYPTDLWLPGEIITDGYLLSIPGDLPPGTYQIRIGLYLQSNGLRLSIPDTPDDAFFLPVEITAP